MQSSVRQFNIMQKFIFFHDQGAFSVLFISSLLLHIILVLTIGIVSELWVKEPPPIRAKIGVSFTKAPSIKNFISKPKPIIQKPVLQKLKTGLKPKLHKLQPEKSVLKKPLVDNKLKKIATPKPDVKQTEVRRLKISPPVIKSMTPSIKQSSRPLLLEPASLERAPAITNLPKFNKIPVLPSPFNSEKSVLKPSQIEFPEFSREEISPKKLKKLNLSKSLDLPMQKIPEMPQPTLDNLPTKSLVKPMTEVDDKPNPRLEELFPEEISFKEPLQGIVISEQTDLRKTKDISDTNFLQRKKIAQLAGEEYNLHIRTQIIPKLGSYPAELFVRIQLKIIATGEIIHYEFIKKSGFSSFDQAAELAVRNAVLDPLPQALAQNPPYIVLIRIVPQN